ncbi:MAG: hypothetical protein HFP77_03355 [Methylococcales symbiont of Iophon sp. n. MRB-2018]|nr:MAG: hypothetical protein HFP77_03355 [Methylococcales symbiont of Iophon sp. n. MRB-2018]KAF3980308.1 MAG: hypothetical protein HFP76_02735 [Methylococcales symbiont of Iophon sp. n. MRB-2018]
MGIEDAKYLSIILSAIVAILLLIKAIYEYTKSTQLNRTEEFFKLDKQFMGNKNFIKLFSLLDTESSDLKSIDMENKMEFLHFYENIGLMVNSGIMKKHVAHYMFSYYAIRCWESDYFWYELNRESPYWALFVHFVDEMKKIESNFIFEQKNYKL